MLWYIPLAQDVGNGGWEIYVSFRQAQSTLSVPGNPVLHSEILSHEANKDKRKPVKKINKNNGSKSEPGCGSRYL